MNWLILDSGRMINLNSIMSVPSHSDICHSVESGLAVELVLVSGLPLGITSSDAYRIRQRIANSIEM